MLQFPANASIVFHITKTNQFCQGSRCERYSATALREYGDMETRLKNSIRVEVRLQKQLANPTWCLRTLHLALGLHYADSCKLES